MQTSELRIIKFEQFKNQTLFDLLDINDQLQIKAWFLDLHLTFQEFRQVVEASRDLQMWGEARLSDWIKSLPSAGQRAGDKAVLLKQLQQLLLQLKHTPRRYNESPPVKITKAGRTPKTEKNPAKNIFGWCPVASDKTVCCNLRTIDAVQGCAFGCSYCTIQTFYNNTITFDAQLSEKLRQIELDPGIHYHIGTGQSSDALVWGNHNGMLDALCSFARSRPNILLEFKTKAANVDYFLTNELPSNIVCSWSLNPQVIINYEESGTASLDSRLLAARRVADRGVKIAFHFHPIIVYDEWHSSYPAIAQRVMDLFDPDEVLFVSFGSLTFIKPALNAIRRRGWPTRILQMEMAADPHGKWTYPDAIKIQKFRLMKNAFAAWQGKVFFYLCMEKAAIWQEVFGSVYPDNRAFEQALLDHAFAKIG
jgi:spore photoproduct lyase